MLVGMWYRHFVSLANLCASARCELSPREPVRFCCVAYVLVQFYTMELPLTLTACPSSLLLLVWYPSFVASAHGFPGEGGEDLGLVPQLM